MGHAGQTRVLGLQYRIVGAWPLRIVDELRGELGKENVADCKVEGRGRTDHTKPIDESRTIRGHDHAFQTRQGWLGSAYEIVDDFRRDSAAWLDFAEVAGFERILVWGHSLGAVKLLYLLGTAPDERIVRAIASSPPRFHYAMFVEGAEGAGRLATFQQADALVAAGQPDALVEFEFGNPLWFSAGSLLDKYGPDDRYDFYRHLPNIELPLLLTLGGLEDGLGFAPLTIDGPAFADKYANLTYATVEGADHSYLARVPEVWSLTKEWLLA